MQETNDHTTIALLRKGLEERGYRVERFKLGDRGFTRFRAPSGLSWLTADRAVHYPFLNYTARVVAKSKSMSYELAQQEGVTIPKTFEVSGDYVPENELEDMLRLAPLVVKPNAASLARGLTIDITNREQLQEAIQRAREYSETVLCQQQIEGEEVRIAVIDGTAKATILRKEPVVMGDGKKTIGELIDDENASRRALHLEYNAYPLLKDGMVPLKNVDMDRVLDNGETYVLRRTAMIRYGASVYNISNTIHESYLRTAEKLANALGNGLVAVDMFVSDYRSPQSDTNYAFLEYNLSPILDLFYSCRDGNQYPILDDVIPLIDKNLRARA